MTEQEIRNSIILAKKEKKYIFQWHITHKCNLRCKHCYLDEYAKEPSGYQLRLILKRIVNFLEQKDAYGEIDLTGGEPFVSPYLFNILDWLEREPRVVDVVIGTNGTLLDEDTVLKLKQYKKFKAMQISIDGTIHTHDLIRGKGSFNKSIKAINILQKHNIRTSISFTANRLNYKEFYDVADITIKAGADVVWTDRVVPLGSPEKREELIQNLLLTNDEFIGYLNIIKKAEAEFTQVRARRPLQYLDNHDGCGHTCSAGKSLLTITADCNLMPCRRLDEVYGSLLEHSITDLLSVRNCKTMRTINEEIHITPDECRNCSKIEKCQGGSKCLTHAVCGTYNASDPNCIFYKEA